MPAVQTLPHSVDLTGLKARQHDAWSSGDYALIGSTLQIVGEQLCEALDLRAGHRVLDVAAGNGNASLAAARRWCEVTATDYVPALLARARARAEANGFAMAFREADAENLPFDDASFDFVTSTFGVMFTPDQERAAAELARVCKPHGRIGLANWTPQGFIGELFKAIGRHVPPPAGARSPLLWGTSEHLHALFGERAASIHAVPRAFIFRYRSAAHFLDVFRTYYGPAVKAFAALDDARQEALAADLEAVIARFNRIGDGSVVAPGEYLEVVVERK
ncbi:MAG: methyltransferase domain-containing protein [Mesorhizobium sp.]|nr:class I SAM-dependent methyltransferase [Mesorhizobium sp.]MBN9245420.1 methyltransferase domain-containing protein [Mesorhizobium sp.]